MDALLGLLEGGGGQASIGPAQSFVALLLAFVLGQVLSWTYAATHSGLSYSKTFVQSLILICVVVSLVMAVVANSFITALGLLGAMALIRFRNMLKDTRDIAFVFASLVVGMASGAQRFATAILGTAFVCALALYLRWSDFGAAEPHNAFLQFQLRSPVDLDDEVAELLDAFCRRYRLVSVRREPGADEATCAFQLLLRRPDRNGELVRRLEGIDGVRDVGLNLQEPLLEI